MLPSESERRLRMFITLASIAEIRLVLCRLSALASFLRTWLDQCPEDFQEPPNYPCLHRLMGYLRRALPGSEALRRAEGLLEQLQTQAGLDDVDGWSLFQHSFPCSIEDGVRGPLTRDLRAT